ncbi:hypothetical protein QTN25_003074 [Entamoeba marina]
MFTYLANQTSHLLKRLRADNVSFNLFQYHLILICAYILITSVLFILNFQAPNSFNICLTLVIISLFHLTLVYKVLVNKNDKTTIFVLTVTIIMAISSIRAVLISSWFIIILVIALTLFCFSLIVRLHIQSSRATIPYDSDISLLETGLLSVSASSLSLQTSFAMPIFLLPIIFSFPIFRVFVKMFENSPISFVFLLSTTVNMSAVALTFWRMWEGNWHSFILGPITVVLAFCSEVVSFAYQTKGSHSVRDDICPLIGEDGAINN